MAFRDGKRSCLLCDQTPGGGSGTAFDQLAVDERNGHKKALYSGDSLSIVEVYQDAGFTVRLYEKTLAYASGLLASITVLRDSDSLVFGKNFVYVNGDWTETHPF